MRKQTKKDRTSPKLVFVTEFADGEVTCMSTHCADGILDLHRGIALSHDGHKSRTGNATPSPIARGKFIERGYNDTVIKEYSAEELKAAEAELQAARRRTVEAERAEAERRRAAEAERQAVLDAAADEAVE
jgi:hypothetical protein